MMKGAVILTVLVLGLPSLLSGQERFRADAVPRDFAEQLLAVLNDPATIRSSGLTRIPAGSVVRGDVGALGGPYVLGGRIEGNLTVVNGDLVLDGGAEVTGDVTVAGGSVRGEQGARIGGELTVEPRTIPYARRGDELVYRPSGRQRPRILSTDLPFGHARFTIRAASNYSRVEGLPVLFGPLVETRSRNPLTLEALGIWRSISGLDMNRDELGFRLRAEQSLGGREELAAGASRHSEIVPIEDWALTNVESSLATFRFRRDVRDYYERDGWSVFLRYSPQGLPVDVLAEFREEEHRSASIRSPWTLGDEEISWRPQPLAAEGTFRSVSASLHLDPDPDRDRPSEGWRLDLSIRRGMSGALRVPAGQVTSGEPMLFGAVDPDLTTGFVDVRRYLRLGPDVRLALRGLAGGALTEQALPPQFQRTIGGEGSLPGHPRFVGDCGARATPLLPEESEDGAQAFGAYGCDRIALLQLELLKGGDRVWSAEPDAEGQDGEWDWRSLLEFRPSWSLFLDGGRGWALEDPSGTAVPRADTPTLVDAGAGVFLGPLGLYWALPLTERERGVNFFVRLQHRF